MSKRAILYARVSGDDTKKEGRNLASQLEMCKEYSSERGWTIVAELAEDDRGARGASFELEQLNRALSMARGGEFDVLVVRELDRLSRSLAKQLIVEEEFKRHGVQIEYVLGEYPDTPEGGLMKNVRAVIAEYERLKINERMIRGRRNKVKDGNVLVHSTPPYGYELTEVDGKTNLAIFEPEARIVRLIYNCYVHGDGNSGGLTIEAITRKLTSMSVPTRLDTNPEGGGFKKRGYGEWCRATVARILGNEVYKGTWHYGKRGADRDTWMPVPVPSIIDDELWGAVQARRRQNRDRARRNRKYHYLLTGRIRCGQCGTRANGHPNRWRSKNATGLNLYYQCAASRNRSARAGIVCRSSQFRVDKVDVMVWEYIKSLLVNPSTLAEGLKAQQAELERDSVLLRERLVVVDDLLDENQQQLDRLLDLYLRGDFPQEMLTERKARLEGTIESLRQERRDLAAQIESVTLSDERLTNITEFAGQVAQGLKAADEHFEIRQQIIEELDVQVTVAVEQDEKVLYVRCFVGESRQCLESTSTRDESVDV